MEDKKIKSLLTKAEELVRDIDDEAIRVKAFELTYNELVSRGEGTPQESTGKNKEKKEKPISIKEFILKYKTKSDVEKTLVVGHCLERIDEIDSFTAKDLNDAFFKAKEKTPSNMNDKINKNIARGFIMEAPQKKEGKKSFVVTRTGEVYLEKLVNNGKQ